MAIKNAGKKKIITLSQEEDTLLNEASKQKGIPSTQIIRDALKSYLVKAVEYPEFNESPMTYEEFIKSLKETEELSMTCSSFRTKHLIESFAKVESKNYRVAEIYLNAYNYSDVRKWGREILDIETSASTLRKGIMAHCWGARMVVTRKMPIDTVLVLSESEFRIGCILKLVKVPEDTNQFLNILNVIDVHARAMSGAIAELAEKVQ